MNHYKYFEYPFVYQPVVHIYMEARTDVPADIRNRVPCIMYIRNTDMSIYVQAVLHWVTITMEMQVEPSGVSRVNVGVRKLLIATGTQIQTSFLTPRSKKPDHFVEILIRGEIGLGATHWTRQYNGTFVTVIMTSAVSIPHLKGALNIRKGGWGTQTEYSVQLWGYFAAFVTPKLITFGITWWYPTIQETKTSSHNVLVIGLVHLQWASY